MAPFDSLHSVALAHPLQQAYDALSSDDAFLDLVRLSSACHSTRLLATEHLKLTSAFVDAAVRRADDPDAGKLGLGLPLEPPTESKLVRAAAVKPGEARNGDLDATRFVFELVERITYAGGLVKTDVYIYGSQTVVPARHLHLYETSANNGLVKIFKLRQFKAGEGGATSEIHETIRGDTTLLLRRFTEKTCRDAHQQHMSRYHEVVAKQKDAQKTEAAS